jgi:hypothetical protein
MAHTREFNAYTQHWDVVIIWDKDHTMVGPDNRLRPKLKDNFLELVKKYPDWKQIILTENTWDSTMEMFENEPSLQKHFDIVLCYDNYFSKQAVRKYLRHKGIWWPFGNRVRRERTHRRERRVNDIFLGKKVILIDDLHYGRVPLHSCCIPCKVWTGEAYSEEEYNWPDLIEDKILSILKRLYHYHPAPFNK